MMKDQILAAITDAEHANKTAMAAKMRMSGALASMMRQLIRPEQVIDLRYDPRKERDWWLYDVKTMRGNDRGTKLFRIASEVRVEANPDAFALSKWSCEAVPISEKTWRSMSGRAHGREGNKGTVTLSGLLFPSAPVHLRGNQFRAWDMECLLEIIAKAEAAGDNARHSSAEGEKHDA